MIWQRNPLWAKAKLFLERAFEQAPDDPQYGLWCAMGLELLARAAISSVSPTLLAEPERDHKNLLYALGFSPEASNPKSISTSQVFAQCAVLFSTFTKEDVVASMALVNRRNAELHSAEAAFESYPSKRWLPSFYHSCSALVQALDETLEDLLGPEQAEVAAKVLGQSKKDVEGKVKSSISAFKRVFEGKQAVEREFALDSARTRTARLVYERHHKVVCPACGADAVVEGDEYGPEKITHEDGDIVVRRAVYPHVFECFACGLKLAGYAELDVADLGGNYTRRTTISPEIYYGLIDPATADMSQYVEKYLADMASEYDNE